MTRDGNLNWFFDQWVRGTAIPRYAAKLDVQPAAGGKYHVTGTITQSEVPEQFAVLMPIYLNFDKGSFSKLGDVAIVGSTTKNIDVEISLPKAPRSVTINAMHDVLAR